TNVHNFVKDTGEVSEDELGLGSHKNQNDEGVGLPFKSNTFDFVHLQNAAFNFTEEQWKHKVIPELVRVTKVGGWIELCELGHVMGLNLEIASYLGNILESHCAGQLTDFHHKVQMMAHHEQGAGRVGIASRENCIQFYRHTIGSMILETINNHLSDMIPQHNSVKGKEKEVDSKEKGFMENNDEDICKNGMEARKMVMTREEYEEILNSADEYWEKN
ncbi:11393_t:CDS:2, partial [Acaulospora colombiana]